jgi:membrane associated rhomboid family serine protease
MGLYDRHYYRDKPRSGVGAVQLWSLTTWLMVINIALFLTDAVFQQNARQRAYMEGMDPRGLGAVRSWFFEWGYFSLQKGIFEGQAWRLITFQFLHGDLWHLLVNMLGLWMFGPVVELNLGSRRYALFYFLCGIAGPVMYAILWGLGILMPPGSPSMMIQAMDVPLVGASAGIFGILLAAAYLSPERPIFIFFGSIALKYFAWILLGIAAYVVLVGGRNSGGQAAHLGGGLLGWVLIRNEQWLDVVAPKRRVRGRKVKDWSRDFNR